MASGMQKCPNAPAHVAYEQCQQFEAWCGPCTAAAEQQASASSCERTPVALILEPSRDLAQQTHDNIAAMKHYLRSPSLRSVLLVGGVQPREAIRELQQGIDIVTGTPGLFPAL
jgi:ATP-dependent RNA helicase DDX1